MKTITLNGGNFGAMQIEAEDGVNKVGVLAPDGATWCYDFALHKKSATADFVGCDVAGYEAGADGVMIVKAE